MTRTTARRTGGGLNPNLWLADAERVAAAKVGQEPSCYVRNIYTHYVA